MPTGQMFSQAPQLVHWPSAVSLITAPTTGCVAAQRPAARRG